MHFPGVTVAFESPHRLLNTLHIIHSLDPDRKIAVVREMTKKFEECRRGTPSELMAHFEKESPRGEIVLCIQEKIASFEGMTIHECVEILISFHGLSPKEAVKEAAKLMRKSRKEVYEEYHQIDHTNH